MKHKMVGIDLGSSNLIIYTPSKGIVFNEPNYISVNLKTKKVVSTGYLALKMQGKEMENVQVFNPVNNGLISSISMESLLIKTIIIEKNIKKSFKNAKLIISSCSDLNEVNILSLKKLAKNLDVESVEFFPQSYLALLGCDNGDISSRGNLVVTLGGGCSDICVTSGTKLLISKTSSFSGKKVDEAITRHLRKKHHLIIGEKTSEYIKMKIGSVEQFPENRLLEVSGRDLVSSLPSSVVISTVEIKQVIASCIKPLIEDITDCLEITPPEISSDIIESGIIICGGMSILGGMREYLESNLNIAIRVASDPTYSVINGIKNVVHQRLYESKAKKKKK